MDRLSRIERDLETWVATLRAEADVAVANVEVATHTLVLQLETEPSVIFQLEEVARYACHRACGLEE